MKTLMMAAALSLFAISAQAQTAAEPGNDNPMTSPNGVDSTTTGGQGTGAGADAAGKLLPIPGTDSSTTGSMTTDDMAPDATMGEGAANSASSPNSAAGTAPNGVDSTTTTGQGTGAGADMAK